MSSMKQKGPAKTTPKHGKNPERRLYSTWRRGIPKNDQADGGINPDGTIDVAAVCGSTARIYSSVKEGRKFRYSIEFASHGGAALFAVEHDAAERAARARRSQSVLA